MAVIYEYGEQQVGKYETITEDLKEAGKYEFELGVVYQFTYEIKTLIPLPEFMKDIQKKIAGKIAQLEKENEGFKVLYMKIENSTLIMQCVRELPPGTIALTPMTIGLIAAAIIATFIGIGLLLIFKEVAQKVKELPPIVPPVIGAGTLIAIIAILYLLSKKK